MKALNLLTLVLVIIGGANWGLVGLFNLDLVATLFGAGSLLSRGVYLLVGVSAVWQLVQLFSVLGSTKSAALRASSAR